MFVPNDFLLLLFSKAIASYLFSKAIASYTANASYLFTKHTTVSVKCKLDMKVKKRTEYHL